MAPTQSLLLLLSFLFFLCFCSVYAGKCNKDDKRTLLAIKAAYNTYHFSSWIDTLACCDWNNLECNSEGRVTSLAFLQDPDLFGTITPAIGDLPYLDVLRMHHLPNLVGPIPDALVKLKRLRFLTISWTNVSGSVPAFISRLPNLNQLDLSFNNLSGAIPVELANAASTLYAIDISRNKLSGSLPPLLFHNSNNTYNYLELSHNGISGVVPADYGNVNYVQIDLSRNNFSGDASFLFGKSKSLQLIDLSRNYFEFNLSRVEFPEYAFSFDLSHNKIFGSIPQQITDVGNLQVFNVSYNRLCGEIPNGGKLDGFDEYNYLHNKCLCGAPLPVCK